MTGPGNVKITVSIEINGKQYALCDWLKSDIVQISSSNIRASVKTVTTALMNDTKLLKEIVKANSK